MRLFAGDAVDAEAHRQDCHHHLRRAHNLSPIQRAEIVVTYDALTNGGTTVCPKGSLTALAGEFGVTPRHVRRLHENWTGADSTGVDDPLADHCRSGRPTAMTPAKEDELHEFAEKRHYSFTWEEAAAALNVGCATLWRWAKKKGWRTTTTRIVPTLTAEQKARRLTWAREHMQDTWTFHIDIDEKYFYFVDPRRRIKLPLRPTPPSPTCAEQVPPGQGPVPCRGRSPHAA